MAYVVQHPDYQTFMDAQQAINFAILKRFESERIDFAYPTQVVLHAPAAALPGSSTTTSAEAAR